MNASYMMSEHRIGHFTGVAFFAVGVLTITAALYLGEKPLNAIYFSPDDDEICVL